ncbi:hypothetical protein VTO42DRAFT_8092 [Malbranchea cinnamomea]
MRKLLSLYISRGWEDLNYMIHGEQDQKESRGQQMRSSRESGYAGAEITTERETGGGAQLNRGKLFLRLFSLAGC